jgi:parvulin-like peptidyl-prolyl isomerase
MHDGRLLPDFVNPDQPLATVGGRVLTVATYVGRLTEAWSGVANPEVALGRKAGVLDRLILDELTTVEGLRRGYGSTAEVERRLHALEVELLVRSFLEQVVAVGVEVSAEEARDWYDANRERFRRPPLLNVSQITVATEAEADEIVSLARSGADFAWLARQRSLDESRHRGGDRGWMPANKGLPAFLRELVSAAEGAVLGPRKEGDRWLVARVNLVEDQGVYDFREVSGNVHQQVLDRKIAERIGDTLATLRERSEIWIDSAAVEALRITPTAPRERSQAPGHED